MPLSMYNTLTNQKDVFQPREPGIVKMYVCGLTVYDHSHIGHARSLIVFDLMRRYLEYSGFKVTYVQNITDIDDRIINRANENGEPTSDLAKRFTKVMFSDMDSLGIRRADAYPKATENIAQMVEFIQKIMANGYAYESNGNVYFDVQKVKNYGVLSNRKLKDMIAGARVDIDQNKRFGMDFALWKTAKPGEPTWESPWGSGRPGWHIECSTMAVGLLGEQFDIHGGGNDLVFPHHENEILQSESATGKSPWVNYWLHVGLLNVSGEKMSKSLGNFLTIKQLLRLTTPEVFRLLVLQTHYRSPLEFSQDNLEQTERSLEKLTNCINGLKAQLRKLTTRPVDEEEQMQIEGLVMGYTDKFRQAMDDDFNTREALAAMFEFTREVNRITGIKELTPTSISAILEAFEGTGAVLGLFQDSTAEASGGGDAKLEAGLIEFLIEMRNDARENKDWPTSDRIRDRLTELGITLEDGKTGTSWKKG